MSINLKDDFYTYVNYKWLKNKKLDDNKAKLSEFTILHEKNNKKIKKIILKNKLLKHIYKLGLSKKSFDVIFPLIDYIKSNDLETILAYLTNIGIDHLFNIKVEENLFNNKENILFFDQPSLSINKDMYNNPNIYNEYKKYIYKYAQILKQYDINIDVPNILKYEKKINELLHSLEEHRNINDYYTLIKYNDFAKKINFDLNKYISLIIPNTKIKEIIVGNKNYLYFIKDEKIIKDYLIYKVVESCGVFLSDEFEEINFNFYGRVISIQNEMVFPAGILQPPFFDIKKSEAYNYGTIGFIIGHEICHGFDDQGSSFDEKGNLKNWWIRSDEKKYKIKIKLLQKQFDKIKLENNKINGTLTLGENIADLCGVTIAFNALKKANKNLTLKDKKEFFISFAKLWRQKMRSKELSRLIKSDVHSPGILRVNEVLKNMDEFYETFDITKNDKMYIKPVNRIKIF
jgi:predicted metalloendopeptidase